MQALGAQRTAVDLQARQGERRISAPSQSRLQVTDLEFTFEMPDRLRLDGGILHGALGAALHTIAPHAYRDLYEATLPPYRMSWRPATLRVILFGPATRHAVIVVQAVQSMAERGLGRMRLGVAVRMAVQNLGPRGRLLLQHDAAWMALPDPVGLGDLCLQPVVSGNWSLVLETPLAFKRRERIDREPPSFSVLLARSIERCTKLLALQGEFPVLSPSTRDDARQVALLDSDCQWHTFERYSARQGQAMPIGGIAGTLRYSPAPVEALAWIAACSWLGVGAKTTFGLGQIRIAPSEVARQN